MEYSPCVVHFRQTFVEMISIYGFATPMAVHLLHDPFPRISCSSGVTEKKKKGNIYTR